MSLSGNGIEPSNIHEHGQNHVEEGQAMINGLVGSIGAAKDLVNKSVIRLGINRKTLKGHNPIEREALRKAYFSIKGTPYDELSDTGKKLVKYLDVHSELGISNYSLEDISSVEYDSNLSQTLVNNPSIAFTKNQA
ncbi:hypothetical protein OAN96_00505 [Candidatus Gracilibacteria bacterium]|nr:hypothetical protein [Candidatus Gracilibacteria bacterium]